MTTNCENRVYNLGDPLILGASFIYNISSNSTFTFTWSINPIIQFISFDSKFFVQTIQEFDTSLRLLRIDLRINDSTSSGNSFLELRVNSPPQNGNLTIFPLQGDAFSTFFSLKAQRWVDENIPLTYQYFYKQGVNIWSVLSLKKQYSDISTILPTSNENETVS